MSIIFLQDKVGFFDSYWNIGFLVLYVLLFIFFIVLIRGRYIIKDDRRRLRVDYKKLLEENTSLNEKVKELKFTISVLESKNTKDKNIVEHVSNPSNKHALKDNEGVQDELSPTFSLYESNSKDSITSKDDNFHEKDFVTDVYYLGFPDNESIFYAPEATSQPTEESFYEIRNDELFLFDGIKPTRMQMALNFVENHIKRVCIIQNSREQYHSRIRMIDPGKVIRQGDDYKITEKMVVQYE